tara:strand:- start:275 stop:445 length:171 start_codon:yes stop_codon:yes gene_type:complete
MKKRHPTKTQRASKASKATGSNLASIGGIDRENPNRRMRRAIKAEARQNAKGRGEQ